jgi:hypothetical protein
MEPLSKTVDRGSVEFSLFASFFALLQLEGKVIGTFIGFGESL